MLEAYGHPTRGYHDLEHLTEVLTRVEELSGAESTPVDLDVVRLAAFFHDVVYDTRPGEGPSNEEASAQRARDTLTPLLAASTVERVVTLVRATYDHRVAEGDLEGSILMDADLAILAADPPRYARYLRGVRREYAHVPEADVRAGRARILADLVDRDPLFRTAHAQTSWEERARENLRAELSALRASAS